MLPYNMAVFKTRTQFAYRHIPTGKWTMLLDPLTTYQEGTKNELKWLIVLLEEFNSSILYDSKNRAEYFFNLTPLTKLERSDYELVTVTTTYDI
jgi:hypothetical protein